MFDRYGSYATQHDVVSIFCRVPGLTDLHRSSSSSPTSSASPFLLTALTTLNRLPQPKAPSWDLSTRTKPRPCLTAPPSHTTLAVNPCSSSAPSKTSKATPSLASKSTSGRQTPQVITTCNSLGTRDQTVGVSCDQMRTASSGSKLSYQCPTQYHTTDQLGNC